MAAKAGVKPRSPKGRTAVRWLDACLRLQPASMPTGAASLKTAKVNQKIPLTAITVSTAKQTINAVRIMRLINLLLHSAHHPRAHVN